MEAKDTQLAQYAGSCGFNPQNHINWVWRWQLNPAFQRRRQEERKFRLHSNFLTYLRHKHTQQ